MHFVRLTSRSVRRHALVLMGPDLNKCPSRAINAHLSTLSEWSLKIKRTKQNWSEEVKEKETTATPNKSVWTILLSAFGPRDRGTGFQTRTMKGGWSTEWLPCFVDARMTATRRWLLIMLFFLFLNRYTSRLGRTYFWGLAFIFIESFFFSVVLCLL